MNPDFLHDLTHDLRYDPAGYWIARSVEAVSYPREGNDLYFMVEDGSFWFRHRSAVICQTVRSFPPPDGGPIVDVGGGNGYVALSLNRAGLETVLVEPHLEGVCNAVRRGLRNVVCATLESARFAPASFSGVGLFDVLEHIEDDIGFLQRLQPLLRPGGRLYLTVPACPGLWSAEDDYAGHYRRYSPATLTRVLEQANLQVEYVTYFFWALPPAIWAFRTLPSRFGARRSVSQTVTAREHGAGSRLLRFLAERTLAVELGAVRCGLRLPFGSSCLAVARSKG